MSSFDVGQENLFTIFEMAPGEGGIPGGMGMTGAGAAVEDYNFTDDFDTGGAEYGVDENVLDLSDAEAEGFGTSDVTGPMSADEFEFDTSGMDDVPSEDAGPGDFDLNLSEDLADDIAVSTEIPEPEAEADDAADMDFTGGFDEVEGLGFGFDESPAEEALEEATEETGLDTAPEPEVSLEPELDMADEQPSLELSEEPELDMADEQPSLELSEEPSLELPEEPGLDTDELDAVEEEPSLELPEDLELPENLELPEEPELMETAEMDDEGGIDFDLDSVDLDEPEEVSYEVPEAETGDEETPMDFEGLDLEMESPEEPEDEDLNQ